MNKRKEEALITGTAFLIIFAFIVLEWTLLNHVWIGTCILVMCPIIALLLKIYYQREFDKSTTKGIGMAIVFIIISASLFTGFNKKGVAKFQSFFVDGEIRSGLEMTESDDGRPYEDRFYAFFPKKEKDKWKADLAGNVFWILLIGSPILTIKLASSIKPKENPNEKNTRRRFNYTA